MGHSSAVDMVTIAGPGDQALRWHLFHNHYPPLPSGAPEVAVEALRAIAEGEPERTVDVSEIGEHRRFGTEVPAFVIAEDWHLDPFIDAILCGDMEVL